MKTHTVRFNKFRSILLAAYLILSTPIVLTLVIRLGTSSSDRVRPLSDTLILFGFPIFIAVVQLSLATLILKKLKRGNDALILNEQGIWSNVSGLSEIQIPWNEVVGTKIFNNPHGLMITTKPSTQSGTVKPRTILGTRVGAGKNDVRIFHHLLDKKTEDIAALINTCLDQNKANDTTSTVHSLEKYVNKAA